MKKIAVIFAGGTGQRMGGEVPKQFLKVSGKEIIIHTLELFESNEHIDEIYVVCIKEWIPYLAELIKKFSITKITSILPGGKTGQDSIFQGLDAIKKYNDNAIVLIHDGVRPLLSSEVIYKCVVAVEKYGSAITSIPSYETPIISYDGKTIEKMPQRSTVYIAKAPQCFYLNDIYELHLKERKINPNYDGIVDSCSLMFKYGIKCHIIEGNRGNIKVTTPEDYCSIIGNFNARDYQEYINVNQLVKRKKRK